MTAERLTVLQLGDVAGVAPALSVALREHTAWSVVEQRLLEAGAGLARPVAAVMQPVRAGAAYVATRWAVARARPDVVHLHWARLAPFIGPTRCPLVIHAHGSDVRGRAATSSGRLVWRHLVGAELVLASTPDLLHDLPPGAVYLPNPVDVDLFSPAGDDVRDRSILVFARLIDVKGAPTIIEAARRLRARHPDVSIRAFAGGTYDDDAARAGVTLLPFSGRGTVVQELQAATIVIGQQRLGTLGLSELEAMACARPVVVRIRREHMDGIDPPVAAIHGTDGSAGVDEIVAACSDLLDDPVRRDALGAEARRYVIARHAYHAVANQLDALYRGLL